MTDEPARAGLLLRLAGPLQSWGEHSTFAVRDTAAYPTRSGIIGLLAAAQGLARTASLTQFTPLDITLRVDRPGTPMADFHTVGGGLPRAQTVITAEGTRRPAGATTIVSHRYYLADAVFTAAINGPASLITHLCAALRRPMWNTYLGRRSCPTEAPLLVAGPVKDATSFLDRLPLSRPRPRAGNGDTDENSVVEVDFVYENDQHDGIRTSLNDVPESFHPQDRRYHSRDITLRTMALPASLCAGYGLDYLDRLIAFQESLR